MLRILGIPISDGGARGRDETTLVEGTPDALSAAAMLSKGVDREPYAIALTRAERTARLSRSS
ncbi:MAG: hypothetical protein EXQ81_05710 [Thermoleophilia bacterium]|nr:hypothetical protein [Thermoleophilia bacterium]